MLDLRHWVIDQAAWTSPEQLVAKIVLFWDRARNEFAVERGTEHHSLLRIGNGNRDEARKVIKIAVTYGPYSDGEFLLTERRTM